MTEAKAPGRKAQPEAKAAKPKAKSEAKAPKPDANPEVGEYWLTCRGIYAQDVAGESYHRENLQRICGGAGGNLDLRTEAHLIPEKVCYDVYLEADLVE